jgi:hypothetical protein
MSTLAGSGQRVGPALIAVPISFENQHAGERQPYAQLSRKHRVFSECSRAHLRRGTSHLDGFPNRVLTDAATPLADAATPLADVATPLADVATPLVDVATPLVDAATPVAQKLCCFLAKGRRSTAAQLHRYGSNARSVHRAKAAPFAVDTRCTPLPLARRILSLRI